MALEHVPRGPERPLDSRAWPPGLSPAGVLMCTCYPPVGFTVHARGPKQESTNMLRNSRRRNLPSCCLCVPLVPRDLYVRVSDLLRNKEVQEQIHKMAKIAEDGEALLGQTGADRPLNFESSLLPVLWGVLAGHSPDSHAARRTEAIGIPHGLSVCILRTGGSWLQPVGLRHLRTRPGGAGRRRASRGGAGAGSGRACARRDG